MSIMRFEPPGDKSYESAAPCQGMVRVAACRIFVIRQMHRDCLTT